MLYTSDVDAIIVSMIFIWKLNLYSLRHICQANVVTTSNVITIFRDLKVCKKSFYFWFVYTCRGALDVWIMWVWCNLCVVGDERRLYRDVFQCQHAAVRMCLECSITFSIMECSWKQSTYHSAYVRIRVHSKVCTQGCVSDLWPAFLY